VQTTPVDSHSHHFHYYYYYYYYWWEHGYYYWRNWRKVWEELATEVSQPLHVPLWSHVAPEPEQRDLEAKPAQKHATVKRHDCG
jgi:hypothetical protein